MVVCEQGGNAEPLADWLGFTCHIVAAQPHRQSVAVLSRYPIIETFANGVRLELDSQQSVCVFGVHLTSFPYQPYRVRDKAYTKKEEILDEAKETREQELVAVLSEIRPLIEAGERVLLCGDFNEPSHLDWTLASAVFTSGSCLVPRSGCPDRPLMFFDNQSQRLHIPFKTISHRDMTHRAYICSANTSIRM